MFGGNGNDAEGVSVTYGDLWRLNPQSSGWSLIPSSGFAPAARAYATSWADANGDLWLFGGQGRDANGTAYVLNDLWKFSVSTGQWSRVGGSARKNMPGVYGLAGVAAADSLPGGRSNAVSWVDPAGTLWVFGGYGIDATGALGTLSDLWQFTPSTGLWIWASGPVTATGT
jgi:N-acetylneuraminic acid mutarotase